MSQPVPVSPETHGNRYWQRLTAFHFAAQDHTVSLAAQEIPRAALVMPLAYVRQENRYILVGLLSPSPGENYFVDSQGRWLGAYIPAYYRGQPFSLLPVKGQDKKVLCVDEDAGLVSDTRGEPFFDKTGSLSQPVKDIFDFLTKLEQNRAATDRAVSAISDAGLIARWPLTVKLNNQEIQVPDLFTTDAAGLGQISDDVFLRLRKVGSLTIVYAQLLSMGNTRIFEKLAQLRAQVKTQPKVDLDKLLGDDDIFKF